MLIHSLFAVALVLIGGVLVGLHLRSWRSARERDLEGEEFEFAHGQYRRRMQTSAMVSLVGVLIFIGQWVSGGVLVLFFWLAVVLIVVWIMLLAMADVMATRVHFYLFRKYELI